MDQSSFVSSSSQYKKRKPIFNNSPVNKLNEHFSKNSSSLLLDNISTSPSNTRAYSHLKSRPNLNNISVCVTQTNPRPQISYSQPKINAQQINPHVIYHQRPITPKIVPNPIPQHIVPSYIQPTAYTQQIRPNFYQTQKLPTTTLKRSYQAKPQNFTRIERPINMEVKENIRRVNDQQPQIKVQRVTKQIGAGKVQKQMRYLQVPKQSTYPMTNSHLSYLDSDNELTKLQQLNGLLSQNYNLLYNQFFNLKKDIREEDVVQEQTFLKNSISKIEYIFDVQTSQALHQIDELFQRKRVPMKKIDNFI